MSVFQFAQISELLQTEVGTTTIDEILHNPLVQAGLSILAIVIINKMLRDLIHGVIRRSIRRSRFTSKAELEKRATTVTRVVQAAATLILGIIGVIFILGLLGVNIAALATGAGLVSVLIGLSAQNTIKDFLAGIFLITENQYGVGDIITIRTLGGWEVTGTVEDLNIRMTKIRDIEGVQHIISNGTPNVISNNTARYSLVNMSIHIGYTADLEKVKTVINKVGLEIKEDETWGQHIIEPIAFIRIDDFEDYAVSALMIGKVKPGMQYDVAGEFRGRLLKALKASKIEVPISQVVAGKVSS